MKDLKPNYFVIPGIAIAIAWIKKFFWLSGFEWFKSLHAPAYMPPMWFHMLAWKAIFLYTTIAAVVYWNTQTHNQKFWQAISLFIANIFFVIIGHYAFYSAHHIGAALVCVIGVAVTVWSLICMLWKKNRLAASLLLPYGLLVFVAVYNVNALWLLN